ncbi:hypothetical protein BSPWISOXPB_7334 [uncultured Gammaproteobacteria bacterium]|nr:hypothetical protein BSPWISOXPB_7334 [uncultured Gammaproteobacteria bacterium]
MDIKLIADSQDNRKGHYGEDNNIYLNDANLNNTKDLATTLGHETSHAIDNQDPSINTNPQNNTSKADNEIYAQNYGDDFSDYVEFASENYGDGNLADTNNNNLGNTPAERQRNQKLINNNNQDYARIDKSKGEDLCSGTNCYGKATQKRFEESLTNPNVVVTITNKKNTSSNYSNYQVREMQDKNGKVIAYSAYNPNTGKNIIMKPEELTIFKGLVENNLMYSFENATNYQNTTSNALNGLHDDGAIGGTGDSWKQYAKKWRYYFRSCWWFRGWCWCWSFRVGAKTSKVVGKIVKSVNKVKVLKTVKIRKQVIDLFDKIKPNNQITIGYKKLTALPENGGARVFKGVSDKQVMAYFKQLTGSKLPKKIKVFDKKTGIFKGNRYSIKTDKGSFNLRDYHIQKPKVNLMKDGRLMCLINFLA